MKKELGLESLEERRTSLRLILMHKILEGQVGYHHFQLINSSNKTRELEETLNPSTIKTTSLRTSLTNMCVTTAGL